MVKITTTWLIALLVFTAVSFAQSATVGGTIFDAQAHPVSGVRVSVQEPKGKPVTSVRSDHEGHYEITGLSPAAYDYVVFPPSAVLAGGSCTAYLNSNGLTIDWTLSTRGAVAIANEGIHARTVTGNPWGLSDKDFGALVAGGILAVGDGLIGRCAAGACFSGTISGPSM